MIRLERDLRRVVRLGPVAGDALKEGKQKLAGLGYGGLDLPRSLGGAGHSAVVQAQAQFTAGYTDLDLRDVVHIGHGRIPLLSGSTAIRERWQRPLIAGGELAGILATEPTGGTALHRLRTRLHRNADDRWSLSGKKQFVSRIREASVFTVLARDDEGELIAAVLPADRPGITVEPMAPAGLGGWSWGSVSFTGAEVHDEEIIHDAGAAWASHFDYYRPMIGATVLGAAAAYWDLTVAFTRERKSSGVILRPRDTALHTIGKTEHMIRRALIDVMYATIAVERRAPRATVIARAAKAGAVETARAAIDELAWLLGAFGYQANSRAAKIRADVDAYRFADGHDIELMRSVGRLLLDVA